MSEHESDSPVTESVSLWHKAKAALDSDKNKDSIASVVPRDSVNNSPALLSTVQLLREKSGNPSNKPASKDVSQLRTFVKTIRSDLEDHMVVKLLYEWKSNHTLAEQTLLTHELQLLAQVMTVLKLENNETVMKAGEKATFFALILKGSVNVLTEDASTVLMPRYEIIGEQGLFTTNPTRPYEMVTNSQCVLALLTYDDFFSLLHCAPILYSKLIHLLACTAMKKVSMAVPNATQLSAVITTQHSSVTSSNHAAQPAVSNLKKEVLTRLQSAAVADVINSQPSSATEHTSSSNSKHQRNASDSVIHRPSSHQRKWQSSDVTAVIDELQDSNECDPTDSNKQSDATLHVLPPEPATEDAPFIVSPRRLLAVQVDEEPADSELSISVPVPVDAADSLDGSSLVTPVSAPVKVSTDDHTSNTSTPTVRSPRSRQVSVSNRVATHTSTKSLTLPDATPVLLSSNSVPTLTSPRSFMSPRGQRNLPFARNNVEVKREFREHLLATHTYQYAASITGNASGTTGTAGNGNSMLNADAPARYIEMETTPHRQAMALLNNQIKTLNSQITKQKTRIKQLQTDLDTEVKRLRELDEQHKQNLLQQAADAKRYADIMERNRESEENLMHKLATEKREKEHVIAQHNKFTADHYAYVDSMEMKVLGLQGELLTEKEAHKAELQQLQSAHDSAMKAEQQKQQELQHTIREYKQKQVDALRNIDEQVAFTSMYKKAYNECHNELITLRDRLDKLNKKYNDLLEWKDIQLKNAKEWDLTRVRMERRSIALATALAEAKAELNSYQKLLRYVSVGQYVRQFRLKQRLKQTHDSMYALSTHCQIDSIHLTPALGATVQLFTEQELRIGLSILKKPLEEQLVEDAQAHKKLLDAYDLYADTLQSQYGINTLCQEAKKDKQKWQQLSNSSSQASLHADNGMDASRQSSTISGVSDLSATAANRKGKKRNSVKTFTKRNVSMLQLMESVEDQLERMAPVVDTLIGYVQKWKDTADVFFRRTVELSNQCHTSERSLEAANNRVNHAQNSIGQLQADLDIAKRQLSMYESHPNSYLNSASRMATSSGAGGRASVIRHSLGMGQFLETGHNRGSSISPSPRAKSPRPGAETWTLDAARSPSSTSPSIPAHELVGAAARSARGAALSLSPHRRARTLSVIISPSSHSSSRTSADFDTPERGTPVQTGNERDRLLLQSPTELMRATRANADNRVLPQSKPNTAKQPKIKKAIQLAEQKKDAAATTTTTADVDTEALDSSIQERQLQLQKLEHSHTTMSRRIRKLEIYLNSLIYKTARLPNFVSPSNTSSVTDLHQLLQQPDLLSEAEHQPLLDELQYRTDVSFLPTLTSPKTAPPKPSPRKQQLLSHAAHSPASTRSSLHHNEQSASNALLTAPATASASRGSSHAHRKKQARVQHTAVGSRPDDPILPSWLAPDEYSQRKQRQQDVWDSLMQQQVHSTVHHFPDDSKQQTEMKQSESSQPVSSLSLPAVTDASMSGAHTDRSHDRAHILHAPAMASDDSATARSIAPPRILYVPNRKREVKETNVMLSPLRKP